MNVFELAGVVVASYLIGSIPVGYLMVRAAKGVDIREHGSRVIGATNVMRMMGTKAFLVCMVLDAAKGYVPTLVAWYIFGTHDLQVAAGIAAVLGHDFPVFIGFRGGRGVATSFGVYAALALPLAVGMVAVGVFIVLALLHVDDDFTYTKTIFGAFATFFVLLTHIPNIKRLIRGTEPKVGENERPRARARPRTT